MFAIQANLWPLYIGVLFLAAAACFQWRLNRVPNELTFAFWLAGLVVAGLVQFDVIQSDQGGLAPSLLGMIVGFGVLVPFYARGILGAACVKSQAVFGVWVGCGVSLASAFTIVALATVLAALLTTGAVLLAFRAARHQDRELDLFPAQITLSLGSVAVTASFLLTGI